MELNRYDNHDRYNSYNKYRYKRRVSDNDIPGCYSYVEYPRRCCEDYNRDIKSKSDRIIKSERNRICKGERIKFRRDDRESREGVSR